MITEKQFETIDIGCVKFRQILENYTKLTRVNLQTISNIEYIKRLCNNINEAIAWLDKHTGKYDLMLIASCHSQNVLDIERLIKDARDLTSVCARMFSNPQTNEESELKSIYTSIYQYVFDTIRLSKEIEEYTDDPCDFEWKLEHDMSESDIEALQTRLHHLDRLIDVLISLGEDILDYVPDINDYDTFLGQLEDNKGIVHLILDATYDV